MSKTKDKAIDECNNCVCPTCGQPTNKLNKDDIELGDVGCTPWREIFKDDEVDINKII